MGTLLMAGWLLAGAAVPAASVADTTVELRRGDRVVVERFTGELSVESWSRSSLSVAGDADDVRGVAVTRSSHHSRARASVGLIHRMPAGFSRSRSGARRVIDPQPYWK